MSKPCKVILNKAEFQELRDMQVKYRTGWPAVFSTDQEGNVFPCPTLGWSRKKQRIYVREFRPLDAIVTEYLKIRAEGGRFFVNQRGAFYAPEILGTKSPDIQFVQFELVEW